MVVQSKIWNLWLTTGTGGGSEEGCPRQPPPPGGRKKFFFCCGKHQPGFSVVGLRSSAGLGVRFTGLTLWVVQWCLRNIYSMMLILIKSLHVNADSSWHPHAPHPHASIRVTFWNWFPDWFNLEVCNLWLLLEPRKVSPEFHHFVHTLAHQKPQLIACHPAVPRSSARPSQWCSPNNLPNYQPVLSVSGE